MFSVYYAMHVTRFLISFHHISCPKTTDLRRLMHVTQFPISFHHICVPIFGNLQASTQPRRPDIFPFMFVYYVMHVTKFPISCHHIPCPNPTVRRKTSACDTVPYLISSHYCPKPVEICRQAPNLDALIIIVPFMFVSLEGNKEKFTVLRRQYMWHSSLAHFITLFVPTPRNFPARTQPSLRPCYLPFHVCLYPMPSP